MLDMLDRLNRWIAEVEVSEHSGMVGLVLFSVMLGAGIARAWMGI